MNHLRYPETKPSGLDWLGDAPSHWNVKKLTWLFSSTGSGTTPSTGSDDYYDGDFPWVNTSELNDGLIDKTTKSVTQKALDELSSLTLFPRGTLLVALYGATIGKLGILGIPATTNQACCALIGPKQVTTKFIFYWFLANRRHIVAMGYGGGQPNISQELVKQRRLAVPPLPEQKQIAAFLDRKTAEIDHIIGLKERQIALIAENRQALISRAVTRGLDPNVPLKASGIEWLGDVPGHWEMKRLKNVALLQTGLTLGKDYKGQETTTRPYLRVANVQDGYLDLDTVTDIVIPTKDAPQYELRKGDVLMTEGGDFDKLGRGTVWEGQIEGCLHQNHIFAVRPDPRLLSSRFLALLMTSAHGKAYFTSTSQQTTNLATTNSTKLKDFPLPLPLPAEQKVIVSYLDSETERMDGVARAVEAQIGKLKEWRQALISAAVTGKIDVRGE